jgi:organic radical activating enzyme
MIHEPLLLMNQQPPESRFEDKTRLEVHSIFYTIQGEGPWAGLPAVFVRLAGCNLQCPMCDTDYTSARKSMSFVEILHESELAIQSKQEIFNFRRMQWKAEQFPRMVITGGEPFRQLGLKGFVETAREYFWKVQIETNGTLYQDVQTSPEVLIVCSPKTRHIHPLMRKKITAYKYIVDVKDGINLSGMPMRTLGMPFETAVPHEDFEGEIYIQPAEIKGDEKRNRHNMDAAVSTCQIYGYRLSLQLHKIANIP